jgi:hypothetical protein
MKTLPVADIRIQMKDAVFEAPIGGQIFIDMPWLFS